MAGIVLHNCIANFDELFDPFGYLLKYISHEEVLTIWQFNWLAFRLGHVLLDFDNQLLWLCYESWGDDILILWT